MASADGDEACPEPAPGADRLCLLHVHDAFLAAELQGIASEGECAFCAGAHGGPAPVVAVPVVSIARLTDVVLSALSGHGSPKAPPDPVQAVTEHCRPALDGEVLKAVLGYIDQRQWSGKPVVFVPRSCAVQENWDWLCSTVAERDLDLPGSDPSPGSDRDRLESLMGRIADMVREEGLIKEAAPGAEIWRGRMRPNGDLPGFRASDIGSVPAERAAENRMSRSGVPLFYGSADRDTAVVELAARDGRRPFVAVAAFETTRPLRMLDLADIPDLPSPFDQKQAERRDCLVFLRDFARDLSRPVFYDGRKHRDYRPTQYVTDYFRASAEPWVDGIRFRSAHNDGVNYALFVDATQCLEPHAPGGLGTLRLIAGSEQVHDLNRSHVTQAV
ncbi:RES family NAD+ phosphorylase [Streptomyces sp. NPDC057253]|uniref:RES family NAD+ phosphorylase n=1 Tax=Streptomyces sp. NPDC057253 TaxID=3346069 RepID=UPI003630B10D